MSLSPSQKETAVLATAAVASLAVISLAHRTFRRKTSNKFEIPKALLQSPYSAELKVAVQAALECGCNMYSHCDNKGTAAELQEHQLGISTKSSPEDFCTAIDLENEQLVTRAIQQHFPSHEMIGEESVGTGGIPPLTTAPTWIVDPIDGTTNFASGMPMTCVSIGFCVDKKPVLGVVYAPMTNELYMAVKDHGAYRNGVQLIPQTQHKDLSNSVVNFEFGYPRSKVATAKMVSGLENILNHGCRTTRQLGAGVLDLCYVATGRADVVYAGLAGEGWKPWDYCAGVVIARETGCVVEALVGSDGEEFDLYSDSIICATNEKLLKECRDVVRRGLFDLTG
jgi:fructose-1,6-bisphosphatase/inositol monophosphatase family enzyme